MDTRTDVGDADARQVFGRIPDRLLPRRLRPVGPSGYRRNLAVLRGDGLLRASSRWVAVGCWAFTCGVIALMVTPNGIESLWGRVLGGAAILLSSVVGALWWTRGWPRERMSLIFALGAEVSYTAVLLSCADPAIALIASLWFFLIGDYLVFAHRHPAVTLHALWVTANLVFLGVRAAVQPDGDPAFVLFVVLALGGALVVIPVFDQRFTDSLRGTSTRSNELAHRDPLTRLLNRRGLASVAPRLIREIQAENSMIGVMVIDIDRFKAVNDVYGHHHGDRVLELLAQRLQRSVRKHGLVARFGGEEFVVLDRVTVDGLLPLAERLRDVCRDLDDEVPVSVSIGAVGMHPGQFPTDDPLELLEMLVDRADGSMYSAKQLGGHQVVLDPRTPRPALWAPSAGPDEEMLGRLGQSAQEIFDEVIARRSDSGQRSA